MIIYYTEGFENKLKDPSSYIQISKFKLGETRPISYNSREMLDEKLEALWNVGTSPTDGEYNLEGVYKDSTLTLSINIPNTDVSSNDMDAYDIVYVLYEDLVSGEKGNLNLAFIIAGGIDVDASGISGFKPLFLDPQRTILNIEKFGIEKPKCSIKLGQSPDLEFLEGTGLGKIFSIYTKQTYSYDNLDLRYVSRKSYEAYLLEKRTQDDYEHRETTYINNYGLKVY